MNGDGSVEVMQAGELHGALTDFAGLALVHIGDAAEEGALQVAFYFELLK